MNEIIPLLIKYDETEIIGIEGTIYREYVPLLIDALKNLPPREKALEGPYLDLSSLVSGSDKIA